MRGGRKRSEREQNVVEPVEERGGGADRVFGEFAGAFAAFADGPDDAGLAAAHVAGGKDFGDIGLVAFFGSFYVAAVVEFDVEFFNESVVLGVDEAHGQQGKVTREVSFA